MPSADMAEHRIKYDFTNMMSDVIGEHGVTEAGLEALSPRFPDFFALLAKQRADGILGFMDLPYDETTAGSVMKLAASCEGRFENLVVLGIGGSALGTIALKSALCHPLHNMLDTKGRKGRPRLFVLDNIDADAISAVVDYIEPESTLVNVVTKSGGTAETMAQLVIFHELMTRRLGKKASEHFVATTDPAKGELRKMAGDLGWQTLPVPPNVGGRFSVLSAVGLFPAAMLGINIRQLLSGAAYMDRRCESARIEENAALAFAALQYILYTKGANISVLMPYASSLADISDWYRQLWAESLGKKTDLEGRTVNVGPTPVKALGATDQHSQVQLYVEGPYDRSVTFVEVANFARTLAIPGSLAGYKETSYLNGRTINELMSAELKGTEVALARAGRPNGCITLPEVSEFTIGQLIYMLEFATAISGAMYGVFAFDQPGVEAGKIAAYALMGRPGYEDRRGEIEKVLKGARRAC